MSKVNGPLKAKMEHISKYILGLWANIVTSSSSNAKCAHQNGLEHWNPVLSSKDKNLAVLVRRPNI